MTQTVAMSWFLLRLFNLGVTLPVLATHVFRLEGGGYGLMMSVFGIGALPGALLASAGDERPTGRRVGVLAPASAAAIAGAGWRALTAGAAEAGVATAPAGEAGTG